MKLRQMMTLEQEEPMETNDQHIYHHNDKTPSISMEVEKNTKGYNWRVKVSDAASIEEALRLLNQGNDELKKAYGQSD